MIFRKARTRSHKTEAANRLSSVGSVFLPAGWESMYSVKFPSLDKSTVDKVQAPVH